MSTLMAMENPWMIEIATSTLMSSSYSSSHLPFSFSMNAFGYDGVTNASLLF